MPSLAKAPLLPGQMFHLYNRGVDSCPIFKNDLNYFKFISFYQKYCSPVFDTFAYALMGNHFHFIVRVKDPLPPLKDTNLRMPSYEENRILNPSAQIGNALNAYAQYFNKSYERTGPLFERPFERKRIDNIFYLLTAIRYTHLNPIKHNFVKRIEDYSFTSYNEFFNPFPLVVNKKETLSLFGGISLFRDFHQQDHEEKPEFWVE